MLRRDAVGADQRGDLGVAERARRVGSRRERTPTPTPARRARSTLDEGLAAEVQSCTKATAPASWMASRAAAGPA